MEIAPSAQLDWYFAPSRLNCGMLLGVVLAIACQLFLFHTATGFELRAFGRNRRASSFFGLPIARLTRRTMVLSGALAGLAGVVQVSAITHRLYESLSPGWGYEAIAVALLARLNPLAVLPTAILFGALDNGAEAMQRSPGHLARAGAGDSGAGHHDSAGLRYRRACPPAWRKWREAAAPAAPIPAGVETPDA